MSLSIPKRKSNGPKRLASKPVTSSNTSSGLDFVFLDIGCGNCFRATEWLKKDLQAHAYCFDPLEECIASAKRKSLKQPRLHPYQVAVSAKAISSESEAPFYCANDKSSCSLLPFETKSVKLWKYPPGRLYFKTVATHQVPIIRMDKFLKDRRITRVLFARIEAQGSALDVLQSFGTHIVDVMEFAIKVHVTDFDLYQKQTKKAELIEFMKQKGFSVYGIEAYSMHQEEIIWFANRRYEPNSMLHLDYVAANKKRV